MMRRLNVGSTLELITRFTGTKWRRGIRYSDFGARLQYVDPNYLRVHPTSRNTLEAKLSSY